MSKLVQSVIDSFWNFMNSRAEKVREFEGNVTFRRAQREKLDQKMEVALAEVHRLEEEIDIEDGRIRNAEVKLVVKRKFWFGPQGIHWFCTKNKIKFEDLKDYLESAQVNNPELAKVLQYCLDHPGDKEYKDFEL